MSEPEMKLLPLDASKEDILKSSEEGIRRSFRDLRNNHEKVREILSKGMQTETDFHIVYQTLNLVCSLLDFSDAKELIENQDQNQ